VHAQWDNDQDERPIVIVGFMGTGKTTVGRLLAGRLNWPFVDLDDRVVARAGVSILEIFRQGGEAAFRALELLALDQALGEPRTVIATGGGAACRQPNLDRMLARGRVVALLADVDEVLRRTGPASGRPLLDGAADPAAAARQLLAKRAPYYARAHLKIDTVGKDPEDVVSELEQALAAKGVSS